VVEHGSSAEALDAGLMHFATIVTCNCEVYKDQALHEEWSEGT